MRVAILGLAKSGTTALHSAIAAAMPPDTQTLFEPLRLPEDLAPSVLVKVLTQGRFTEWERLRSFDKKIFLMRDPRDRLVSSVLYGVFNSPQAVSPEAEAGLVALLQQKEQRALDVPLRRIAEEVSRITGTSIDDTLHTRQQTAIDRLREWPELRRLRYEDFTAGRIDDVEAYLGLSLPKKVTVAEELGRVLRSGRSGDFRHWLTPEDIDHYRPRMRELMETLGYPDDWELAAQPEVSPEHGSAYVRRLIAEQRARKKPPSPWQRLRGFVARLR